jgi:hypothetical protein
MANPLERAIIAGQASTEYQRRLFASMGTSEHPRGTILTAYRNARRAMATALQDRDPITSSNDVMTTLWNTVETEITDLLKQAMTGGAANARIQLGYYGFDVPENLNLIDLYSKVNRAKDAVVDNVGMQQSLILALIATGSPELILGDSDRIGVLKPGETLMSGAFWLSTVFWLSFSSVVDQLTREKPLQKQAIAAIDNRTTDCCLRVHGQVVDMDKPFKLDGYPRYADALDWSPFHAWCRTSVVLYDERFDDGITERLEGSAQDVLDERSHGVNKTRRPADAYS